MNQFKTALSRRTDRAFSILMLVQWAFAVGLSLWYSPRVWTGAQSSFSPYLFLAIFFGGMISGVPAYLAWKMPGEKSTRHIIAAGQMLMSSLIIHLSGGRIEAHFHIFGSLAFLAFYLDWTVLLTATLVVAADHFLRGFFWPESIFGLLEAQPWRALEHSGWVIFCDVFLIASCMDRLRNLRVIAAQQVNQEELLRQAYTDPLTGLPNRLLFQKEMAERLGHAEGRSFSLMYIDLDHFKKTNDEYGHAAGDKILVEVAKRLRAAMPPAALLTRIGGDEFVAILPADSPEEASTGGGSAHAAAVARELLTSFLLPLEVVGSPVKLGASIGISRYPEHGDNEEVLLHNADAAMYRLKRQGRSGFAFFDPLLDTDAVDREPAESSLRDAISADEFEMHYQPLVSGDGTIKSVEALIRWNSPTKGMIVPDEFIPLAEATGLIVPLGQLALEKACWQAAAWLKEGIQFGSIAVNLSPQQLAREDFLPLVDSILLKHRLDGAHISFEITESALSSSSARIEEQMRALRSRGIRVSLDDFGTGYSSLARLQDMSFDVVKVDRMFVDRVSKSDTGYQVLLAIITLAHLLGMQVVAEGVETENQYRLLQEMSCNAMQGYYISGPLPAAAMRKLLEEATMGVKSLPAETAQTGSECVCTLRLGERTPGIPHALPGRADGGKQRKGPATAREPLNDPVHNSAL